MPWGRNRPTRPHYPEHFPDVVAALDDPDVGGDPARFLVYGDTRLTRARIRGIADTATVRAWIAVANALRRRGRLDDPDYWNVIGRLQERLAALQDRPDETVFRPVALDRVRAKRERNHQDRSSASAKIASLRTDGGDDEAECFRCGLATATEDLEPFELPGEETVDLCPPCYDRWKGRTFIVAGGRSA